jgi:hypothetical protein
MFYWKIFIWIGICLSFCQCKSRYDKFKQGVFDFAYLSDIRLTTYKIDDFISKFIQMIFECCWNEYECAKIFCVLQFNIFIRFYGTEILNISGYRSYQNRLSTVWYAGISHALFPMFMYIQTRTRILDSDYTFGILDIGHTRRWNLCCNVSLDTDLYFRYLICYCTDVKSNLSYNSIYFMLRSEEREYISQYRLCMLLTDGDVCSPESCRRNIYESRILLVQN